MYRPVLTDVKLKDPGNKSQNPEDLTTLLDMLCLLIPP